MNQLNDAYLKQSIKYIDVMKRYAYIWPFAGIFPLDFSCYGFINSLIASDNMVGGWQSYR
jgi:hypothetical protein